jgi:hypothetical protein
MQYSLVLSKWLRQGSRRLAARSYLSDFHQALITVLEYAGEKQPLYELTMEGKKSIFNGPRFSRGYVNDESKGVKLLSGRSVLQSDLSWAPLISSSKASDMPEMLVDEGTVLVTSYGTVGRVAYAGPLFDGLFGSDNVLKIIPDSRKIPPGYLFAYLASSIGNSLMVKEASGGVVTYIDPKNIHNIIVPRLDRETEDKVNELVVHAAKGKKKFQDGINLATKLLFESAGLNDITASQWHESGPDIGDQVYMKNAQSIRALNFCGRYRKLVESLKSTKHRTLGDICKDGQISSGARFRRIDASPEHGVRLIGQKQGFWSRPEGRWISAAHAPEGIFAQDETVMIASQGTLGEREVFCRPIFVTGNWLEYVYTQHFLRVYSKDSEISGAYLYAFLRSETAFRCLRSMSIGSKQQDIHVGMLSDLPVPIIEPEAKRQVEELIRSAFRDKDLADQMEKEAVEMVEQSIQAAVH